ncbi:MAG: HD domain-containing phosphohydrolase [Myxococcota bacterium]
MVAPHLPLPIARPAVVADLRQAVLTLTEALDCVGVDDTHHGQRVAFMVMQLAGPAGLGPHARERLARAGLLHDCGVSSSSQRRGLLASGLHSTSDDHCERGARLVAGVPALENLAPLVLHHHTPWAVLERAQLSGEDALLANALFLCDRVDALRVTLRESGMHGDESLVLHALRRHRGDLFAPGLVDALHDIATPAFWDGQTPDALRAWWSAWLAQEACPIGTLEVRQLARLFAHVVDAKSHFTAEHSDGVARLSLLLAGELRLPAERRFRLEVAALLHDIGKLKVPDKLLDKPGPLDERERALVERHPTDTHALLSRIDGFSEIAVWAGLHHAGLNGSGYAFEGAPAELPLEARIISVADVFQALAQDRPYRPSLPPDRVVSMLWEDVRNQRLDGDVVEAAMRSPDRSWQAAVHARPARS